MNIKDLIRPNILNLAPYSTARDEYNGKKLEVYLDANESPYDNGMNRYPDPRMATIRTLLGDIKKVDSSNIFIGNGSDEAIDLMFRIFCTPSVDNVVMIAPTYGMYKVAAAINDIEVRESLLDTDFNLSADKLLSLVDANTKLIFICSPNNPSGNLLSRSEIMKVVENFSGITVVDEAYVDFCRDYKSFTTQIIDNPNVVVLQTLSKAWGMAGVRCGLAIADSQIIEIMNRVKYPYNINVLTAAKVEKALLNSELIELECDLLIGERDKMRDIISRLSYVERVYSSDSNFLLVKVDDATKLYNYLMDNGVIIRNRSSVVLCENCVRITVGSFRENKKLIELLRNYI